MAAFIREIDSLHGLIEVKREETPPKMLHVLVVNNGEQDIENYVRMNLLPIDLQESIRECVRKHMNELGDKLHHETKIELKRGS